MYDNSMKGVAFPNKEMKTEKHPKFKGYGEVNGQEVWISVWENVKDGVTRLNLSFENKKPAKDYGNEDVLNDKNERGTYDNLEDEMPF